MKQRRQKTGTKSSPDSPSQLPENEFSALVRWTDEEPPEEEVLALESSPFDWGKTIKMSQRRWPWEISIPLPFLFLMTSNLLTLFLPIVITVGTAKV